MTAHEQPLFDVQPFIGRLIGKALFTPLERYPNVGELVWLDTDEETNYHGEAYVCPLNTSFWEVVNPKDPSQVEHIVIAVNDNYIMIGTVDKKQSRYQPMVQLWEIQA